MAAAVHTALPTPAGVPSHDLRRFQGDSEGMVDLLVDACVRAKELQRHSARTDGSSAPRVGRELVSYFNPGSETWGVDDVNVNTDDSDSGSVSDGAASLSSGNGEDRQPAAGKKNKKNKKRGKQAAKTSGVAPVAPAPPPTALPVRFAGTSFGLAAPLPDTLPMPSTQFLQSLNAVPAVLRQLPAQATARRATAHLKAILAGPQAVAAV